MATSELMIDSLLAELGFRADSMRKLALAALVEAGLTNGRKSRIATFKLEAIRQTLGSRFALVCTRGPCLDTVTRSGKTLVHALDARDCSICRGSVNESTIDRAVEATLEHGMRKLVVVGGSPSSHEALRIAVRGRIDLRLVVGTDRRTSSDAKADLAWADLVIIWGSTQLDHKVSRLYTDGARDRVVTCARRGIAALGDTVIAYVTRR